MSWPEYERRPARDIELANLEWRKRRARELRKKYSMTYPEIAERLNTSVGAVERYLIPRRGGRE